MVQLRLVSVIALWSGLLAAADPIFLQRNLADIQPQPDDLTAGAAGASYKPIFGAAETVVRYGEVTVAPAGRSALVGYPAEEQIYFVTEGTGTILCGEEKASLKKNDFMYLPAGVRHGVTAGSAPLKVIVMGYRIPPAVKVQPTPHLMIAKTT